MTLPVAPTEPRYRLAIFDFDGTLADSGDWFLSIADDLADRFKFKHVTPDEVEALRGRTSREVIRYLGIPRWKLPAMARYVHALLGEQADRIHLFDGVGALVEDLTRAGVTIALVTSNAESNARAILGPAIAGRISHFECGASLFGKARLFRRVLRHSKVPAHQAISVGDETRDIAAARKAGIDAAGVLWGYANRDALAGCAPDILFDTPVEVLRHLTGHATAELGQR